MYPYNVDNNMNEKMVKITNKGDETTYKTIKTDKRLKKIVEMAKNEVVDLQEKYKNLMEVEMFAEDKNLIQTMYLDEIKHEKQLNEVLYHLENRKNDTQEDEDYDDLATDLGVKRIIEELILLEMDNVNFYSNLAQSVPKGEDTEIIVDILAGISSNKQTHGTGLSYLYAKYF